MESTCCLLQLNFSKLVEMQLFTKIKFLTILLFCATLTFLAVVSAEDASANLSNSFHHKSNSLKSESTKRIEVAALGRVANLGDLYDVRRDNFLEISLYTTHLLGDAIYSTSNGFSAVDYVKTESYSEKMKKLGVSPSLSASFLGGLVSASGSGEYLNENKKSAKSAKASLIYSFRTVREDLKIFSKTSKSLMDTVLLKNAEATHIVVGIEWGADVVLSLEETNTNNIDAQAVQKKLEDTLKAIALSISDSTENEVDFENWDIESSATFSLHINADIMPTPVPQTIGESIIFIRDIPNLIKNENDGKGKIMKYILMPLSTVRKVFQAQSDKTSIVKDVDQKLMDQFIEIFQEMKDSELEINDIHSSLSTWRLMVPESQFLSSSNLKYQLDFFMNDWRVQFGDLIVKIRNDHLNYYDKVHEPIRVMDSYRNSNWTSANIMIFLKACTPTMHKVRLLELFQSFNVISIDRSKDMYKILADNYQEEIRVISINLNIDISSPYVYKIVELLNIESKKDSGAITYYVKDTAIAIPEVKAYLAGKVIKSFLIDKKEYVCLKDHAGNVIIIDAKSYAVIVNYTIPETAKSNIAIVNDIFYKIDTLTGEIMRTGVENVMASQNAINWTHVGSFPPGNDVIYNSVAVNNSFIYFATDRGVLYLYDTTLKTATKISNVIKSEDGDASLVVVNNILYVHGHTRFYSFSGTAIMEIQTPETREYPGLFQFGSFICRLGGREWMENPDPVSCYNPTVGNWTVIGYSNEHSRFRGITSTESGTLAFGGYVIRANHSSSNYWINKVELFNPETKIWSYVPSPLRNRPAYIQAVTFYY